MNTPTLPPNHELLQPDFLRQHGAVKGLKWYEDDYEGGWQDVRWIAEQKFTEQQLKFTFCAPLGTIAAATTPVPEGRCECGAFGRRLPCEVFCPKNPRNAYVHIPPHQLAQLPKKPEGLMSAEIGKTEWREVACWPVITITINDVFALAFAVPRHVMDQIEQQLSTKGGDEPCPRCSQNQSEASNAAPERSQPSQEAAPSDGEMLAFTLGLIEAGATFEWNGLARTPRWEVIEHNTTTGHGPTLRSAITAAMKEDRK